MKKIFSNKGMTTTAALLLVTGTVALGTAGGVVGYNVYQEKKHEEEVAAFMLQIEKARQDTVAAYNARIEQAMSELTFTNENGEEVTLETNRNIDSMNNVVNNLNAILGDLNNDALLSQEQKDNFYLYDFYLYLHEIRFYLNEIAAYLNEMYQLVSIRFDNWPLLPPLSATSRGIFRELPFNYGRNTDFLRR